MKKKQKKKVSKGSLLLISFLLIFFSYFDIKTNKENNLLASNNNSMYTNVNANELLNILDKERGVILIVNEKLLIKEYISILTELDNEEKIYVYNSKNDELKLIKENDDIVLIQDQSEDYKKLTKKLGFYTEVYTIDEKETEFLEIPTPMVMFIKNGHIEFSYSVSDNDLSREEISNIYQMGFDKLKED